MAVVDDQRGSPTYVGHLTLAVREVLELPKGVWHLAADGDCTWADFAEAILEEAGLNCHVRRITAAELARPARRPAYSVLGSERPGAARLGHLREGLRACLERVLTPGLPQIDAIADGLVDLMDHRASTQDQGGLAGEPMICGRRRTRGARLM